jgi:hypothetical protein
MSKQKQVKLEGLLVFSLSLSNAKLTNKWDNIPPPFLLPFPGNAGAKDVNPARDHCFSYGSDETLGRHSGRESQQPESGQGSPS